MQDRFLYAFKQNLNKIKEQYVTLDFFVGCSFSTFDDWAKLVLLFP